ncbi:hypothetical protein D9756_010568 [Leucocoprinus leucothites]|uniref:Dihydroxyacetone kinase n=1 Tax=Leucocoprinus leucothites TaxID=201217 RepID=A0A8H5CUE6_9AGAR|nr:hypothetical protein D9756_010568 [Leucoagaricus leucothites]
MTTRHFYTSPDGLVLKSLRGAVLLNPSLRLHPASRTVYTTDRSPNANVAVICGGGAGHEPAYAGYTGHGMLTACVSGEIFASPSSKQILNTIRLAAFGSVPDSQLSTKEEDKRNVLVVMNNYTGDRLNFGLAIEKARVLFPEIDLASVVVADDVSLLHSPTTQAVGPRGLAGNILVCKLLGALAHTGVSLSTCKVYGDAVVSNLSSIGVALEHCHVPGRAQGEGLKPLEEDECEVGLGLHNEAGVHRRKMGYDVRGVIEEMVGMMLERNVDGERFVTGEDDETVLFVNNLGGVSQLEMGALLADLVTTLASRNIHPKRIYSSSYMTSLNASGFSASILNISAINQRLLQSHSLTINTYELLDAPTDAHSWIGVRRYWTDFAPTPGKQEDTTDYFSTATVDEKAAAKGDTGEGAKVSPRVITALESACRAVLSVEKELTEYDTVLGDGDCGHTFAAGASAILAEIRRSEAESGLLNMTPAELVQRISEILDDVMGGTIGALFGIYLNAYSFSLLSTTPESKWYTAPLDALIALSKHTTAKPGDRTVIDALEPFCTTLSSTHGDLRKAAGQAAEGAMSTRGMRPKLGRAAYVVSERGDDGTGAALPMDPGAWGIAKLLEGFVEGWRSGGGGDGTRGIVGGGSSERTHN